MSDDEDLILGEKTWNKSKIPIEQDGLREGYEAGRLDSYQNGYDIGYKTGFQAAFKLGYHNAALRVLSETDFNLVEELGSQPQPYVKPERGACILCPNVNRPLTKTDMANAIPSEEITINDIVKKQNEATEQIISERENVNKYIDNFLSTD